MEMGPGGYLHLHPNAPKTAIFTFSIRSIILAVEEIEN
jgi:hypothetical protein